jgi:F0F1-type ATP synthase epsilon subunit
MSWFGDPLKKGKLNLTVKSATKTIYQGQVAAVSFTNRLGPFDILPGHKNLIALIVNKMTLYLDEKRQVDIPLTKGVVKVAQDNIVVYVGF